MACYRPIQAWRAPGGGVQFTSMGSASVAPLLLPCSKCPGCKIDRSRAWALRCVHESKLHERSCFVTLTYAPGELPKDDAGFEHGGLEIRDWQLFAKRVRKRLGRFRFFMCGEYGEQNLRPHFHALMFGQDFAADARRLEGELYTSRTLEELWGKGHCPIGQVTRKSAAYVARYSLKKQKAGSETYRRINEVTGEEYFVRPEFVSMSRRPGIGSEWFERYVDDVYPEGQVIHDGKSYKAPRFYDEKFAERDPEGFERLKRERVRRAEAMQDDQTPERLRVREEVAEARLSLGRRKI